MLEEVCRKQRHDADIDLQKVPKTFDGRVASARLTLVNVLNQFFGAAAARCASQPQSKSGTAATCLTSPEESTVMIVMLKVPETARGSEIYLIRKLRIQSSDNMDRRKSSGGKSQRRKDKTREDQRRKKVRRKKMQAHEKVEKWLTVFSQCVGAPSGRKAGWLKRRQSHVGRSNNFHVVVARSTFPSQNAQSTGVGALLKVAMSKQRTPWWRQAYLQVKTHKTPHARTTLEGSDLVLRGRRKGLCTLFKKKNTKKKRKT